MADSNNEAGAPNAEQPVGSPDFIDVPRFAVSSFTTLGNADGLGLLCSAPVPAMAENGVLALALVPQLFLTMSPVQAKELIAVLKIYVGQVEAERGELTSTFLRSQKA